MRMCHFQVRNGPFVLNFFGTHHYYYCHLPIGPFHCAKFKNVLQQIQSYEDAPFLGPQWSICPPPPKNFFWKIMDIILIYLLASFIVLNFKKTFPADRELRGCAIFGPKMAHFSKWEFFQKTLMKNEPWALFLPLMPIYMPKIKVRY